jgi:hypothetical protein
MGDLADDARGEEERTQELDHDPAFPSWEAEKQWKIKKLNEIAASVGEMGQFLSQFGITGNTMHGKLNAILDMLVETGVITEKQLMDMEFKFAKDTENELKEQCAKVRQQAAVRGIPIPDQKSSGLIVPGR